MTGLDSIVIFLIGWSMANASITTSMDWNTDCTTNLLSNKKKLKNWIILIAKCHNDFSDHRIVLFFFSIQIFLKQDRWKLTEKNQKLISIQAHFESQNLRNILISFELLPETCWKISMNLKKYCFNTLVHWNKIFTSSIAKWNIFSF